MQRGEGRLSATSVVQGQVELEMRRVEGVYWVEGHRGGVGERRSTERQQGKDEKVARRTTSALGHDRNRPTYCWEGRREKTEPREGEQGVGVVDERTERSRKRGRHERGKGKRRTQPPSAGEGESSHPERPRQSPTVQRGGETDREAVVGTG